MKFHTYYELELIDNDVTKMAKGTASKWNGYQLAGMRIPSWISSSAYQELSNKIPPYVFGQPYSALYCTFKGMSQVTGQGLAQNISPIRGLLLMARCRRCLARI